MQKVLLAAPLLALLAACGGSSSGGGYTQQNAPATHNYTTVDVNGSQVDVTKTTIDGYTCLVGVNSTYYHDYSPTIWCDPTAKGTPAP